MSGDGRGRHSADEFLHGPAVFVVRAASAQRGRQQYRVVRKLRGVHHLGAAIRNFDGRFPQRPTIRRLHIQQLHSHQLLGSDRVVHPLFDSHSGRQNPNVRRVEVTPRNAF